MGSPRRRPAKPEERGGRRNRKGGRRKRSVESVFFVLLPYFFVKSFVIFLEIGCFLLFFCYSLRDHEKLPIAEIKRKLLFLCYFLKEGLYDLKIGHVKKNFGTNCYFPAILENNGK